MYSIESFEIDTWDASFAPDDQERAFTALEDGRVLYFEHLAFPLVGQEPLFLSTVWSDQKAKNISFDPDEGKLRGVASEAAESKDLAAMIRRYADCTHRFMQALLPAYAPNLRIQRTSFRPHEVANRECRSYRQDDRRLHVDTFPSRPNNGARILRMFTNINPFGKPRQWLVGEPFETFARHFVADISGPLPGLNRIAAMVGVTKTPRTLYDHFMLQLHDRAKGDVEYQKEAPREEVAFAAGSSWIVFTDQVPHAALSGQFALEQTFELPVSGQRHPDQSPLRVLERLTGRSLTM